MQLSKVPLDVVKKYIGCRNEDDDTVQLYWDAAKAKVLSYTGLTLEQADKHEDITISTLVIAANMYIYRDADVALKTNPTALDVLNMHSVNLL
jgi:hypothetical protein